MRMKKKKGRGYEYAREEGKRFAKWNEGEEREGRKIGIQAEMDDENDLSCGQT